MLNKGFFVFFGQIGRGKSYEAAKTFQNSVYVCSKPGILKFYETMLQRPEYQQAGLRMPRMLVELDAYTLRYIDQDSRIVQQIGPTFDNAGNPIKMAVRATLEALATDVIRRLADDRTNDRHPTYGAFILDEVSALWERVLAEVRFEMCNPGPGVKPNRDGRSHYGELARWTREYLDRLTIINTMGANLVGITHDVAPEDGKQGGPQVASQRTMKIFAGDAHIVIERRLEAPGASLNALNTLDGSSGGNDEKSKTPRLVWVAYSDPSMNAKIRGIPIEELDQIRDMSTEQIIRRAGFEP